MKRKWEEPKAENTKSTVDIELHLETPLPLEWQRCLDIQSGKIHFYNTKTHRRTSKDPRKSPEPPSSGPGIGDGDDPLSLDLELNLNCQSIRKGPKEISRQSKRNIVGGLPVAEMVMSGNSGSGLIHRPAPWLTLDERDRQEMVAGVCMQCHLLVMLLKSSPICPNCKFMHPTNQMQSPPPTLSMASHSSKDQSQYSLKSFPNPIQNKV